jgi:tripartite-type tricarboxylate transporter receptor subunit TctC
VLMRHLVRFPAIVPNCRKNTEGIRSSHRGFCTAGVEGMNHRLVALLGIAGAALVSATPALAQAWPAKPVRIVNTFAPGGAADFLARTIADNLALALGQQFYVETRAGAAGAIGVQSVVNTPPDGYNFVITNITMLVLSPIGNPKLGYDPLRDLTNVSYVGGSPVVLSVNSKSGVKTLPEFIAWGKRSNSALTFSSSGAGSSGHLFGELLAQRLGMRLEHVPYKGAAQGLVDLLGGHIAWSAQTVTSTADHMRNGVLTGVAVTSKERLAEFPHIQTFDELGYPDLNMVTWFSLSGPANLPAEITHKVNHEIGKILARPDMQQRMRREGMVTEQLTPDAFKKLIEAEMVRWRPVMEKAGLIQK